MSIRRYAIGWLAFPLFSIPIGHNLTHPSKPAQAGQRYKRAGEAAMFVIPFSLEDFVVTSLFERNTSRLLFFTPLSYPVLYLKQDGKSLFIAQFFSSLFALLLQCHARFPGGGWSPMAVQLSWRPVGRHRPWVWRRLPFMAVSGVSALRWQRPKLI